MEESEKRKGRLKAMRMEAEVSNDVEASAMPGFLSNPLTETPFTVQDDFGRTPRFDYYTDPMAAFCCWATSEVLHMSRRGGSRGYSRNNIPGLGRSAGRGQDPWWHLKPIPWRRQEAGMDGLSNPDTSISWLPKSIAMKKAKVSEASYNKFSSQQSLAKYLAASFKKAVEDTQNA
ncbi:protein SICKLE-like [Hibiscus syriacus]|uniref:protein SICKLE-like n=1 Tax=Hibiscus syriacus TaxID=106335 RepID=UPI001921A537|nr:protein SICKLE-like [Hibiscus syriacus]